MSARTRCRGAVRRDGDNRQHRSFANEGLISTGHGPSRQAHSSIGFPQDVASMVPGRDERRFSPDLTAKDGDRASCRGGGTRPERRRDPVLAEQIGPEHLDRDLLYALRDARIAVDEFASLHAFRGPARFLGEHRRQHPATLRGVSRRCCRARRSAISSPDNRVRTKSPTFCRERASGTGWAAAPTSAESR